MSTTTAIWIAVVLWFAIGWYLNSRLELVHTKLDRLADQFNGLREYLYEIDPQFDDERELLTEFFSADEETAKGVFDAAFAGMDHSDLMRRKKEGGFRTLHSSFLDGGFRAPSR